MRGFRYIGLPLALCLMFFGELLEVVGGFISGCAYRVYAAVTR